jgi:hypothetical protein
MAAGTGEVGCSKNKERSVERRTKLIHREYMEVAFTILPIFGLEVQLHVSQSRWTFF